MNKACHTNEEGFSLIAVLGFLLLVSSILVPLSLASHNRLVTAKYEIDLLQVKANSRAINDVVASQISNEKITQLLLENNKELSFGCKYNDLSFYIHWQPFAGLVDLNSASRELLILTLMALKINEAADLADALIAYRSRTQNALTTNKFQPEGGEKNSLFESVAELHDFEILRIISKSRLEEFFTVYKKSALLSISHVNPELFSELELAKLDGQRLEFLGNLAIGNRGFFVSVFVEMPNSTWYSERVHYTLANKNLASPFVKVEVTTSDIIQKQDKIFLLNHTHNKAQCEKFNLQLLFQQTNGKV